MKSNFRIFFHLYSHKIFLYLFVATFLCQIIFWSKTESIKPKFDIVPAIPSLPAIKAMSLGDNEFLFRILALRLQNSGDVFAGFVALKNYDYSRLYQWFTMLDSLNEKSNLTPSFAAYYFSQTQNKSDSRYVLQYLDEHSSKNIDENWWWFFQAIHIATNSLHDYDLALKIANKMAQNNNPQAPLWTKQMTAFLYARQGNDCMAFKIIEKILNESSQGKRQITAEEMNFMHYFIKDHLAKLKSQNFDPRNCQN